MHLFYAYGSGLGHLNRVWSYCKIQKLELSTCIVLTNSKHNHFLPPAIKVIQHSSAVFQDHALFGKILAQIIEEHGVTALIVDVFPCGFYGELQNIDQLSLPKTLLARILNHSYFEQFTSPNYDDLVVFEKGVVHENYTYTNTNYLAIQDAFQFSDASITLQKPFFCIIHSEPEAEVMQLYKLAKLHQKKGEHMYIQTYSNGLTFNDKEVTVILNTPPLLTLLENSEKLFTACGYNLFHATEQYRAKQIFMPFKRRYDDQFLRKREGQK